MTCLEPPHTHPMPQLEIKSIMTSGLSPHCVFWSSLTEFHARKYNVMNSLTKNVYMFFDSAKQTIHAVSQNTCHLYYTLRTGAAPGTPSCMERTQKESPRQNQNVLWMQRRERLQSTDSAKQRYLEGFAFPGIILTSRTTGSTQWNCN